MSPDGIGHRFVRGAVFVDVLAPDHLGPRADLGVGGGARTIAVPGGRRVLNHLTSIEVRCGSIAAVVPIPTLAGALVVKSSAVAVDDAPGSQRIDLAFLYSLIDDPMPVRDELGAAGRSRLRRRMEMADPGHEAWRALGPLARRGHEAFAFITRP